MEKAILYIKRAATFLLGLFVTLLISVMIIFFFGFVVWGVDKLGNWLGGLETKMIFGVVFGGIILLILSVGIIIHSLDWAKKHFPKVWAK